MGVTCTCGSGHATFGACLRAKNIAVTYCRSAKNWDYTAEKRKFRELDAYAAARRQGVQPESTSARGVETAMAISESTGKPFDAAKGVKSLADL